MKSETQDYHPVYVYIYKYFFLLPSAFEINWKN